MQDVAEILGRLTYSERKAAAAVLAALPESTGGLVVASHVADNAGLTRSTVANALRKLELAGLVETQSLGMKGTMIRLRRGLTAEALGQQIRDATNLP